jgi:hypothetical protein
VVLTDALTVGQIVEIDNYLTAFLPTNALRTITTFTATAAQTTFSVTYTQGLIDVFYNGSNLAQSEYTATNGTSIVLATACQLNDIVVVYAYSYAVGAFSGIGGSGTINTIPKFTASSVIGDSAITDNGTTVTLVSRALSGTSATFSSSVTATSESSLFKEGYIIRATTTCGGGSQPAYTYYTAAGSKRWSSFLNVGDDKFHIANASNAELFTIQQNGNVGIGTSSPGAKLGFVVPASGTNQAVIDASNLNDASFTLSIRTNIVELNAGGTGIMTFSNSTERMRITSGGYLKASNTGNYSFTSATGSHYDFFSNDASNTVMHMASSSTSYSGVVLATGCGRTANAAYSVFRGYSGDGGTGLFSDKEFDLYGDGNGKCDGSWTGGGADYAEYFEWADGNINNEDRRGYSVSLIDNKIKIAEQGENIIGVISGNPSIVGDAAWNKWSGKHLKDDFGSYILDEEGNRTLNPNYNADEEYIPREQRPEWSVVGLMGKLRIRKGQATMPTWIKMRDVSENVEEWLIK